SRTSPTACALARELPAGGLRPSGAIRWSCSAPLRTPWPSPGLPSAGVTRIVVGRPRVCSAPKGLLRTPRTKGLRVRTYSPKASEIQRAWYVIDAEGLVLGRV